MKDYGILPGRLMWAAEMHFKHGVPLSDLIISSTYRDMLMRAKYNLPAYLKNPGGDFYAVYYELAQIRYGRRFGHRPDIFKAFAQRETHLLYYIDSIIDHKYLIVKRLIG